MRPDMLAHGNPVRDSEESDARSLSSFYSESDGDESTRLLSIVSCVSVETSIGVSASVDVPPIYRVRLGFADSGRRRGGGGYSFCLGHSNPCRVGGPLPVYPYRVCPIRVCPDRVCPPRSGP